MSICESKQRPGAADLELGGLAGLELQHDIYLTLPDWRGWDDVSSALNAAGAEVQTVQISRQNEGFSVRCRFKRVSSEAARSLSGQLLDAGLARTASVEHLMLAGAGGGAL